MPRSKHAKRRLKTHLIAGCTVVALCATAGAWQDGGSSEDDPNLLAGPKVSDSATDGGNDSMTATREQNDRRRLNRGVIPPRLWIREVRHFALTDAQRAEFEATLSDFETTQRRHVEKYGPELRDLARQLRQKRNGDLEMTTELRDRMRAIRAEAPVFEEYQRRIWDVLTPKQRDDLTARLEILQAQMEEERANRRINSRRPRENLTDQAMNGSESMGVNRPNLDSFDELGRRRLQFLLQHKKRGTEGDLEFTQRRRLPPSPPPGPPPADE